ncbi:MAG: hypothetical protein OEZ43_02695 [Gammaproteobacteria bacterium]|nr:hypothetical protein [Gammaproteobacteria bacterium]
MKSNFKYYVLAAVVSSVLTACSGESQDSGNTELSFVSGRAVDGPVAQGYVYLDSNNNNMLDGWEPFALTDEDGYFSYNPKKTIDNAGTPSDKSDDTTAPYDYCAKGGYVPGKPDGEPANKDSQEYIDYTSTAQYIAYEEAKADEQYCLKVKPGVSKAPLRVANGYDLSTSQSLEGTITLEVTIGAGSYTKPQAVTPVGSMLHAASQNESVYPANEPLTDTNVLKQDYMNYTSSSTLSDSDRMALAHMAMMAQKPAAVVTKLLHSETNNSFKGESGKYPYDVMPYVQVEIAKRVIGTETMSAVLQANASEIVTDAWQAVSDDLALKGITYEAPTTTLVNTIVGRLDGLPALIDDLFNDALGAISAETYILQRLRAIEVVATLMRGRTQQTLLGDNPAQLVDRAIINQAIAACADPVYLTNIGGPKVDVAEVIRIFEDGVYVDGTSINFDARVSFNDQFREIPGEGQALDLISAGGDTNFGFVFHDDGTVTVDFQIGGDTAFTSGSQNTVDTTYEQIDENTILMNMELVPGTGIYQPVIMKTNKDGTGYTVDYGTGPTNFVTQV